MNIRILIPLLFAVAVAAPALAQSTLSGSLTGGAAPSSSSLTGTVSGGTSGTLTGSTTGGGGTLTGTVSGGGSTASSGAGGGTSGGGTGVPIIYGPNGGTTAGTGTTGTGTTGTGTGTTGTGTTQPTFAPNTGAGADLPMNIITIALTALLGWFGYRLTRAKRQF